MQRFVLFLCFLMVGQLVVGQARRNNSAPGYGSYPQDTGKVMDIREKLVHLAMQNPLYEIADRQVVIANNDLKISKVNFLANVRAMANYNEYSFSKSADNLNFFPKYNFGVNVPFDIFFTRGKEISSARENLGIAEAAKNQRFREIKAQVLSAYEDYLMHKQKLEYQNQITQDVTTIYKQKERDFSEAIITPEEYNTAYKQWTNELSSKAELQRNFNVAKINLEALIGMTLEEAIAKGE